MCTFKKNFLISFSPVYMYKIVGTFIMRSHLMPYQNLKVNFLFIS